MQDREHESQQGRLEKLKAENRSFREKLADLKRENKNLQRLLRNNNKLINSIPAGIVLIQQGKIIDINETALDQMGYKTAEIIGRNFLDFVHPDSKAFVRSLHKKWVSGKMVPEQHETDMVTKDGGTLCFDIRVNKIRFNGRVALLLNLTRLEKRKRREKELIHSKKMEALITMASGLTRNFGYNLKAVTENTDQLRTLMDPENRGLMKGLEKIESAVGQIINTLRKLDSFSMTENDRSAMTLFDLEKVVRDAITLTGPKLKDEADRRGVKVSLKTYLRSVSPIEGNPDEIRDVIINMILNAVEAMPQGGELYLTTEENAGYAHIYVQDNGEGMPDHIKDRILDPFLTTKGNDGVGLGLSLSYAIVKRNRGEIEVTSQKGQGSIFHVKLPLASQEQKSKAGSVSRRKIKNANILIVEDEDVLSELLSQLFLSKGLRVVTAASSAEGLNKLKRKKFDMVLVDSGRPDIHRELFIQKIKKMTPEPSIAIITENETGDKLNQIKNWAVDLIITKPLEMNRVVNQVSEVLATKVTNDK